MAETCENIEEELEFKEETPTIEHEKGEKWCTEILAII
jgi:hypothetical protein